MQDILHSLKSTFTTYACGKRAKDCAVRLTEALTNGETPFAPA